MFVYDFSNFKSMTLFYGLFMIESEQIKKTIKSKFEIHILI
jgi:hypothetical protein